MNQLRKSSTYRREHRNLRVFLYHRVVRSAQKEEANTWAVTDHEFRRQMELLDRWGFTTITFEDYRQFLAGEVLLPRKPLIITFDDGYADTFEVAFPILRRLGMRAVVFVIVHPKIATNEWDTKRGYGEVRLLKEDQILEMHNAGFEIGSHTLTHPNLTTLSTEAVWDEISRSRVLLEIKLDAPVRTFSFPFGILNSETKRLAKEAGYSTACAAWSGPASFFVDPFEVRRITMRGSISIKGFALRVMLPYTKYRWLVWKAEEFYKRITSKQ